ncbi:MAG: AzlD domain-containing protein [Lachnospiraceae bacterium]|nr:AzlD domain-containing protein [Lachnospiraceae bacterium]
MTDSHAMLLIAVMTVVTLLLRVLPFVIFSRGNTPKYILYLGNVLPFSIMAMLVVYCLKGITPLTFPFGLPELLAVLLTAGLHVWKRNTLLSILAGTISYMLLIQLVFV